MRILLNIKAIPARAENLFQCKYTIHLLSVLLFLAFYSNQAFTQNVADSTHISKPAIVYLVKVDTIISVKLNANTEFEQFVQTVNNVTYDIRPNITLGTKIAFSYRFISFGIGFKPKFIPGNNDNDMQGKTRTLSFGTNIITSHWMQELQFAYIRGFYVHNTGDFFPEWVEGTDPYIQLPENKYAVLRGSTAYKINKNYSVKSISSKTEIQLKSCGSLVPVLAYDYYEMDNKKDDQPQSHSQFSSNFDMVASVGYMYTFVIMSKFYVSAALFGGAGFHHTYLLTRIPPDEQKDKYTDPLIRMQERIGIGYNSKKFFSGVELFSSQSSHSETNNIVNVTAMRTSFQVFAGYRFNAPKFLKHETDVVKGFAPTPLQKILE
jgi:hypothetical protein